mmetsp:Transcript_83093/g.144331  ORF Transcript_83093/g.144331 Transcript_83093/m.144331 type:complete len:158 (-) Transcript_83093:178-651(-)
MTASRGCHSIMAMTILALPQLLRSVSVSAPQLIRSEVTGQQHQNSTVSHGLLQRKDDPLGCIYTMVNGFCPTMVKAQHTCQDESTRLGEKDKVTSLNQCADLAYAASALFFTFGNGNNFNCFAHVSGAHAGCVGAACCSNWHQDATWNFYVLVHNSR